MPSMPAAGRWKAVPAQRRSFPPWRLLHAPCALASTRCPFRDPQCPHDRCIRVATISVVSFLGNHPEPESVSPWRPRLPGDPATPHAPSKSDRTRLAHSGFAMLSWRAQRSNLIRCMRLLRRSVSSTDSPLQSRPSALGKAALDGPEPPAFSFDLGHKLGYKNPITGHVAGRWRAWYPREGEWTAWCCVW